MILVPGTTIPWLASDWKTSADGKEWRFTIRDNATWHDGLLATAEDVAFSFDYITNGAGRTAADPDAPRDAELPRASEQGWSS